MRAFVAAMGLWLQAVCTVASAQSTPSKYESTVAYAVQEFQAGHWEESRALFKRAHEIKPNARTLRGLGKALFEMRRYTQAIEALEASLVHPTHPLDARLRASVQELLERARAFTAVYHVHVDPPDARLSVDGASVSLPADGSLRLNPGRHTLVVEAFDGQRSEQRDLWAEAGLERPLEIRLAPPKVAPVAEPTHEPEVSGTRRRARTAWRVGWALGASALAFGAATVGFRAAFVARQEAYEKCDSSSCALLRSQGETYQLMRNLSLVLSAATAAGAVVSLSLSAGRDRRTHSATVGPGRVGYRFAF